MAICGKCGNRLSPGGACYICARIAHESRRYGKRHRRGYGHVEPLPPAPRKHKKNKVKTNRKSESNLEKEKLKTRRIGNRTLRSKVVHKVEAYNRLLTIAFNEPLTISKILIKHDVSARRIESLKADLSTLYGALIQLDRLLEQSGINVYAYDFRSNPGNATRQQVSIKTPEGRRILEAAILRVFRAK